MVVFLAAITTSLAQSYKITPNDTFQITGTMEDLETLSISQLNTSNDTITFKWKKISESVPANWEASVCDNFTCYTTLMDSGITNPVSPAETGFLLLHITAHVNAGITIIRYAIWDIKNDLLKDTLTFIMNVNANTGIGYSKNENIFKISPNPVNDIMNINSNSETGFQFVICDLTGKSMISGSSNDSKMIVATNIIPNGFYIVSFFDKNSGFVSKKIIICH